MGVTHPKKLMTMIPPTSMGVLAWIPCNMYCGHCVCSSDDECMEILWLHCKMHNTSMIKTPRINKMINGRNEGVCHKDNTSMGLGDCDQLGEIKHKVGMDVSMHCPQIIEKGMN